MKNKPLTIDIGTLLKMVRFLPSFRVFFEKNKYLTKQDKVEISKYVIDANLDSKSHLWEFCCVESHIVEINILIVEWEKETSNSMQLITEVQEKFENVYSHDIIGRMLQFDENRYKDLLQEMKRNRFHYNGMVISNSNINKNNNRLVFLY